MNSVNINLKFHIFFKQNLAFYPLLLIINFSASLSEWVEFLLNFISIGPYLTRNHSSGVSKTIFLMREEKCGEPQIEF